MLSRYERGFRGRTETYDVLVAAGLLFFVGSFLIPVSTTTAGRTAAIALSCAVFLLTVVVVVVGPTMGLAG